MLQGFASVEGESYLAEPPPYTPVAAEPLPIRQQAIRSNASLLARPLPAVMPLRGSDTTTAEGGSTETTTRVMTLRELANSIPQPTTEGSSSSTTTSTTTTTTTTTITHPPPHPQPPPRRPNRGTNRRCSHSQTMETLRESPERNNVGNSATPPSSQSESGYLGHQPTATNQSLASTPNDSASNHQSESRETSQGDCSDQVVPESSPFVSETEQSLVAEVSLDDTIQGAGHDLCYNRSIIEDCDISHSNHNTSPGSEKTENSDNMVSKVEVSPTDKDTSQDSESLQTNGADPGPQESLLKSVDDNHDDSVSSVGRNQSKSSDCSTTVTPEGSVHQSGESTFV